MNPKNQFHQNKSLQFNQMQKVKFIQEQYNFLFFLSIDGLKNYVDLFLIYFLQFLLLSIFLKLEHLLMSFFYNFFHLGFVTVYLLLLVFNIKPEFLHRFSSFYYSEIFTHSSHSLSNIKLVIFLSSF